MRRIGVEEELLLVRPATPRATPSGEEVVQRAAEHGRPVEQEFKQEQIEIASEPQSDASTLLADLVAKRAAAIASAAAEGVQVAAIATSPGRVLPRGTEDERYQRMVAEFGLLAAEQLTCGQHIHVDVADPAEGVRALDRIRGWLPVLVALSGNSPFWSDRDTGYASFRSVLWGRWPSAGPAPLFGDEDGYRAAIQQQLDTGSALDDGMIYFDARLSARYPTVEIRVADVCTDVRDAVLLAVLARGLVDTAVERAAEAPLPLTLPVLRAASWRAARWGMEGTLINPLTGLQEPADQVRDSLLDWITPALHASGDLAHVQQNLRRIERDGTGAQRQRAVFARTGELAEVVADAVRRTAAG
ncbi:MAG TPA: glutamate--cysteine ligase [Jatrophihabitans sp.]|nr:glutamate--cysteine ligase [Jatrophihabitans sp.]